MPVKFLSLLQMWWSFSCLFFPVLIQVAESSDKMSNDQGKCMDMLSESFFLLWELFLFLTSLLKDSTNSKKKNEHMSNFEMLSVLFS